MTIRIVLADDHAVFRSGLRALLEKEADLEIVGEAGTGPLAIEVVERARPDVLVLDLGMPELSGARVAERLLDRPPDSAPCSDLAIVVLTMHEDEYYLRELLSIGARAFVLKQSTGTDLLRAIRAAHRGERYVDPALTAMVIGPYVGRNGGTSRHELLTRREREVCRAIAYEHTNAEVASALSISVRTVETHRTNIMSKLRIGTRAELVRFAIAHGLLQLE